MKICDVIRLISFDNNAEEQKYLLNCLNKSNFTCGKREEKWSQMSGFQLESNSIITNELAQERKRERNFFKVFHLFKFCFPMISARDTLIHICAHTHMLDISSSYYSP